METNLIYGRNAVNEAIKSGRPLDTILVSDGALRGSASKIIAAAYENNLTVKQVNSKKLDEICEKGVHQGIAAFVSMVNYYEIQDILASCETKGSLPFIIICDGIEDPRNLGAIIRTAEGAGADGIIIPKRGSAQITPTAEKAAQGALNYIKIARVTNIAAAVEELKSAGVWIYGADAKGSDSTQTDFSGPAALVLGSEGKGISRLIKEKCDFIVSVPMYGQINSLNVSVAGGILMYDIARSRQKS